MIYIDKYRIGANIREYHIVSKIIFLRIIISKFMIRKLFHEKNVFKCLKWTYGLYIHTYRIAMWLNRLDPLNLYL